MIKEEKTNYQSKSKEKILQIEDLEFLMVHLLKDLE